jgi:pimeloyl-ACP methyl ester carboxylesterase
MVSGTAHHYVTAGEGRPLVLIHGFPQTWLQWKPLIERLAEKLANLALSARLDHVPWLARETQRRAMDRGGE